MNIEILYPWKMCGRYEDDFEITVGGNSESDCMWRLCNLEERHGNLTWYSGFCNEDYVDGEYVGRDNFIYD